MLSDVARFVIIAGALLLGLAVIRLHRIHHEGGRSEIHPAFVASYVIFLVVAVIRRAQNLGNPADVYLWLTAAAVLLGLVGTMSRLDVTAWRPGGRHRHPTNT